jgi:hypothetical protein
MASSHWVCILTAVPNYLIFMYFRYLVFAAGLLAENDDWYLKRCLMFVAP